MQKKLTLSRDNIGYILFVFIMTAALLILAACSNVTAETENDRYDNYIDSGIEAETQSPDQNSGNNNQSDSTEETDTIAGQPAIPDHESETNDSRSDTEGEQPNINNQDDGAEQNAVTENQSVNNNQPDTETQDEQSEIVNQDSSESQGEVQETPSDSTNSQPAVSGGVLTTARTVGISTTHRAIGATGEEPRSLWIMNEDGTASEADETEFIYPEIALTATTDPASLAEFESGARRIIEGRMFQSDHEAIVSREFAALNNIVIGDIIEFQSFMSSIRSIRLTIVGVFSDTTPEFLHPGWPSPATNRRNEIIISYATLGNYPQFAQVLRYDDA
jgi:hypothetical protein